MTLYRQYSNYIRSKWINKQLEDYENIIAYLAAEQRPNGEFPSLESYPTGHPRSKEGWFYVAPSPFITANILCALLEVSGPVATEILQKGIAFLESLKEGPGLWRFWPHSDKTHPVPLDMDDTCLCSFLLEKHGRRLSNKRLLRSVSNPEGHFFTWILPRPSLMWRWLLQYWFLRKDLPNLRATLASPMLSVDDFEPAVEANILLYLQESAHTKKAVLHLLLDLSNWQQMPLQYYPSPLFAFYHAARAYHHGVRSLQPAKDLFLRYYEEAKHRVVTNLFEKAVAANTFLYFELSESPALTILLTEIQQEMAEQTKWEAQVYFTSKNRDFRAGSPALTAALCAEVLFRAIL